jgi:type VI secretion system secreted protein VgrG
MEKEFYKQLKAQEDGINKMTVGQYTSNRKILNDLTAQHGHKKAREILTQGGKAQEAARKQLSKKIQYSIEESLAKNNIYGKEAEKLATEQTQRQMDQLAALHDPDLIAGGNDTISSVGNKNVNSSLGSQWAKDGRADKMDKAAGKAMAESGPDTPMNVKLERCKD